MVSIQTLRTFLDKKVFIKIIDDRTQVGTLTESNGDFFLEGHCNRTAINPDQIARITEEFKGDQ